MRKTEYFFYRILGNDIPLRHRKGQTLSNLKIILEKEPMFANVEKRWIVNRIVDAREEQKIIKVLDKNAQKYKVIKFNMRKFKKIPKHDLDRRLDELIGLNDARNLALREGKKLGRWTLVFDGSCFFTLSGWRQIVRTCSQPGRVKYVIVPMLRMFKGEKRFPCEPQIIFRRDSAKEFDTHFRYGHNSKVELLCRLGVPGIWDQWDEVVRMASKKRRAKGSGEFCTSGYVWRLPSGNEKAEMDVRWREMYRKRGIELLMAKVEENDRLGHWI